MVQDLHAYSSVCRITAWYTFKLVANQISRFSTTELRSRANVCLDSIVYSHRFGKYAAEVREISHNLQSFSLDGGNCFHVLLLQSRLVHDHNFQNTDCEIKVIASNQKAVQDLLHLELRCRVQQSSMKWKSRTGFSSTVVFGLQVEKFANSLELDLVTGFIEGAEAIHQDD